MSFTIYFLDPANWSIIGLIVTILDFAGYLLFFKTNTSQKVFMLLALSLIYMALGSPIGSLTSFGLHSITMLKQIVLLMVAPIFLLRAFPSRAANEKRLGSLYNWLPGETMGIKNTNYFIATWILMSAVMWGGHFLSAGKLSAQLGHAICGLSLQSNSWVTHVPNGLIFSILLVVGIIGLLPVFHPMPEKRLKPVQAVAYLFTACLVCTVLGLYVAFSATSAPNIEAVPVFDTVLSPLPMSLRTDQELAGMLMRVPGCIIYVISAVEILLSWYNAAPATSKKTTEHFTV